MKSGMKTDDDATTPVIAARILNAQLNNSVDAAPLQQFQQQGGGAIPLGSSNNGNSGESGQNLNWASPWGNSGYDAGNSAGV
jgi:hypothetical protein